MRIIAVLLSVFIITFGLMGCAQEVKNTAKSIENVTKQTQEVLLDKTYKNERFNFEVSYPGIWSIEEEASSPDLPDQGVKIYINNSKEDYVRVFGQDGSLSLGNGALSSDDFTVGDGVKGKIYTFDVGKDLVEYSLELKDYNVGATVKIASGINDEYKDIIAKILKSIKVQK